MHERAHGSCAVLTALSGHLSSPQLTSARALPTASLQVAAEAGAAAPTCMHVRAPPTGAPRAGPAAAARARPPAPPPARRRPPSPGCRPRAAAQPLGQGGVAIWCIGTGRQTAAPSGPCRSRCARTGRWVRARHGHTLLQPSFPGLYTAATPIPWAPCRGAGQGQHRRPRSFPAAPAGHARMPWSTEATPGSNASKAPPSRSACQALRTAGAGPAGRRRAPGGDRPVQLVPVCGVYPTLHLRGRAQARLRK